MIGSYAGLVEVHRPEFLEANRHQETWQTTLSCTLARFEGISNTDSPAKTGPALLPVLCDRHALPDGFQVAQVNGRNSNAGCHRILLFPDDPPPRVDYEGVAIALPLLIVLAGLRSSNDIALALDSSGTQQQFPVRFSCRAGSHWRGFGRCLGNDVLVKSRCPPVTLVKADGMSRIWAPCWNVSCW